MFDGENDGSGTKLPWVCVFGGLQRKIEIVKMKDVARVRRRGENIHPQGILVFYMWKAGMGVAT
jgi:hypothetical protein